MLKNILILLVSTIFTTYLNFGVARAGIITETREVVGSVTMFGSSAATTGVNSDDFTGGLIPGNFIYQGDINSVFPLDIVIGAANRVEQPNMTSLVHLKIKQDLIGQGMNLN